MTTDRLSLTNALEAAKIERSAAERIATEILDAIHNNVATKTDLRELEQRVDLHFEQVERRIDTMTNRLVAAIVVALTVLFGALHLWPPHS
jgi:hypothetical protein